MPDRQILACDLGGTRMRTALVSLQGRVHDKQVVLSLDNNPNTLVDALRAALEQAPRQGGRSSDWRARNGRLPQPGSR